MSMRGMGVNPIPTLRTPPQTRHIGLGTGFINKYQPVRIKTGLLTAPELPGLGYIGAVLLACAKCLFLYVSPIFSRT